MDARTKRAWTGLVRYANGVVTEAKDLRRIVADCMDWVAAIEPFGLLDPILGGDEELLRQAVAYRASVDGLLRWLCYPKSQERDTVGQQALDFLHEHTQHIGGMRLKEVFYDPAKVEKLNFTPAELEHFKEQHNRVWADWKNSPLGILTPSKEYEDIADPICDFVLSEYQKYRSKEFSKTHRMFGASIPIFICPNPKCQKLVLPERSGRKKYCSDCSDRARAEKYRQKASPDESKDYQWLYRLRQKDPAWLKILLRQPNNQKRLREIKERQRSSSRCQLLILGMRL